MSAETKERGAQVYQLGNFSPIVVREGRLEVNNWKTEDNDIVSFFENKPDNARTGAFERIVKVGVVASNLVETTQRIDYIEKEFSELKARFDSTLDKTLGELGQKFDEAFGEKGLFAKAVQDTFGDRGKVVKEIFDPARDGTPLYQLRTELLRKIDELRTALAVDKAKEQIERKTPKGGFRFEDEVEIILGNIVKQRKGDKVERTTTTVGRISHSKKGDFVLTIAEAPEAPIVIETKALGGTTFKAVEEELNDAMENRAAAYAILVARDAGSLPASAGWFNEYGDHLLCALGNAGSDILREEIVSIAVSWARMRVLLKRAWNTSKVDSAKIGEAVEKATGIVDRVKDILTQCRNLENATDGIRRACREMNQELTAQLDALRSALGRQVQTT